MKIFNLYKVDHNTPTILVIDITNVNAIDFTIEGLNAEQLKRHLKEIEDPYHFGGNNKPQVKLNQHSDIDEISITSDNIVSNKDLNFLLENFINIKSVSFNNCKTGNIDILHQLKKLDDFGFAGSMSTPFDLSKLKNLNSVFLDYHKNLDSIFKCSNLVGLEMHKFPEKDSIKFIGLENLKKLILRQFKMTELEAISKLPNLEYLEISHNRIIDDLSSLNQNKTIKELGIRNCSRVKDFSPLSKLQNLETLFIDNQKEIPSLDFIKEMPNLKRIAIIGSSNVIDGKLKWLLDKENIQLIGEVKKHYDIKWSKDKEENFILVSK